ncbi:DNA-protecting protein DprA [Xenorhabdus bovienii]|uniref:DNA-protecting protein DprA n=1 Tax=Xenorhabdus bovienii TaxID=40576 RepID=UPI00237CB22F|nr:DNA-protecting protein DprA [Xenorhabdus bovienii]MDE1484414.1 DNA-protecting protein DprA [Xenorhabdus bovienii]MDE9434151.1 DNA-protecting protein DprA [Xenorhabdus bovienii]MDE9443603.1 DNA-protecting protein DprA [Xenorhabdus bovienii]MDE9491777.1 DNA-protecting protein DprA [Xenorhabdus bovienii]MDE9508134.1 DNA-protecting protein DprA [Xenorhabdus bovienii]
MKEMEIWLRMKMVSHLSTMKAVSIIERLLKTQNYSNNELKACGLSPTQCLQFTKANSSELSTCFTWLERPGNHLLTFSHPAYPPLLKQIHSPPLMLFVSGDITVLSQKQVAMVGSRSASFYGEKWGKIFAGELAKNGVVITSGLAIGIDGICHQAALSAGGKTIAVLGSGLEKIYPYRHDSLARLIEENGALVSEFFPEMPPKAKNFPRRNRIISGLSLALLIVEAYEKSGSLITARCALEQGRDIFALPGALGTPSSEGNHWLIKQGAYLAVNPTDIMEHINGAFRWLNIEKEERVQVDQIELPFADVLVNVSHEVTPVDVIAQRSCLPVTEVMTRLLELELMGKVAVVAGGYIRIN